MVFGRFLNYSKAHMKRQYFIVLILFCSLMSSYGNDNPWRIWYDENNNCMAIKGDSLYLVYGEHGAFIYDVIFFGQYSFKNRASKKYRFFLKENEAGKMLTQIYTKEVETEGILISVINKEGKPIKGAVVIMNGKSYFDNNDGIICIPPQMVGIDNQSVQVSICSFLEYEFKESLPISNHRHYVFRSLYASCFILNPTRKISVSFYQEGRSVFVKTGKNNLMLNQYQERNCPIYSIIEEVVKKCPN